MWWFASVVSRSQIELWRIEAMTVDENATDIMTPKHTNQLYIKINLSKKRTSK